MKNCLYNYFLLVLFCCVSNVFCVQAQELSVEIVEVKDQKKISFYAINHTKVTKEVFFKVSGNGFRKSSYRPVIKKVPAQQKVLLTVLIPLKNVTPEYTYFHSVENQLQEIHIEMKVDSWKDLEYVIDRGETIIFTKDECAKCEKLTEMLLVNRIKHKVFNISENERYKEFFWNTISKMKRRDVLISSIPIAIVKGELHEGLNLISFVEMLKQ